VEIDPRRLTRDHVAALREVGFNRASIGVQDFNPKVQTAVHRIQPRDQTEQAIEWARAAGFPSVNLDLDLRFALPDGANRSSKRSTRSSSLGRTGWRCSVTRMCRG
jgi:oxygen-independent coproporphyrinogen-3 oxidase